MKSGLYATLHFQRTKMIILQLVQNFQKYVFVKVEKIKSTWIDSIVVTKYQKKLKKNTI